MTGMNSNVKFLPKTPPKELAIARMRLKEWKDVDA